MKPEPLKLLIQADNPIISMETSNEPRAVRIVREAAAGGRRALRQEK
jgi:hypothetical protein